MNLLERIMLQFPIGAELSIRENTVDVNRVVIQLEHKAKRYKIKNGLPTTATDEQFIEMVTDLILIYNRNASL